MMVILLLGWILCGLPTGLSTFDCVLGKYMQNDICKTCPRSCSRCISDVLCTACKPGFYGDICKEKCSESCSNGKCLQENGQCVSCAAGYYFSSNKTCVKCPEHCTHCQSQDLCTACENGFTGIKCQEECTNCNPISGCNIDTKVCFAGCKDGYTDPTCVKHCDSKCKACEPVDESKCTSCSSGRYGANCDKSCPKMCRDFRCNNDNDHCTSGCKDGFWGNKCENTCSRNCHQGICHQRNGSCFNGCHENFTGITCLCPSDCVCTSAETCENCSKDSSFVCDNQCNKFCVGSICSFDTHRKCLYGCREGYRGILCGSMETTKTSVVVIVVSVTVAAVAVVTAVILAIILWRKWCFRNHRSDKSKPPEETVMINKEPAENTGNEIDKKKIATALKKMDIKREYQALLEFPSSQRDVSNLSNNPHIVGAASKAYKISLEPKADDKKCVSEFWRMVFDQKCAKIVMLTCRTTGEESTASNYWPNQQQQYGNIRVYNVYNFESNDHYTQNKLEMTEESNPQSESQSRGSITVMHYRFLDWLDNGIPKDVNFFTKFWKNVWRKENKDIPEYGSREQHTGRPILVHCRGDVGNTGVFVALDMLMDEAQLKKNVDIFSSVKQLRKQCPAMFSTEEQYRYVYKILVTLYEQGFSDVIDV